jgi:hypothetical protein
MKARKMLLVVGCVLVVVFLVNGLAAAKATRTEFSCVEIQTGGGDLLRVWEAGKTIHVRGMTGVYEDTCDNEDVSGTIVTVVDINYHPTPEGLEAQFRGTFVNTNAGGTWVGTFQGTAGADYSFQYDAHGKGTGAYEGLHEFVHTEGYLGQPLQVTGYILDPGN